MAVAPLSFSPDHVALSLVAHGMRVTKAARFAGRHPSTIWRWLREARHRSGKSMDRRKMARLELDERGLGLLAPAEVVDAIMTARGYKAASPGLAEIEELEEEA